MRLCLLLLQCILAAFVKASIGDSFTWDIVGLGESAGEGSSAVIADCAQPAEISSSEVLSSSESTEQTNPSIFEADASRESDGCDASSIEPFIDTMDRIDGLRAGQHFSGYFGQKTFVEVRLKERGEKVEPGEAIFIGTTTAGQRVVLVSYYHGTITVIAKLENKWLHSGETAYVIRIAEKSCGSNESIEKAISNENNSSCGE